MSTRELHFAKPGATLREAFEAFIKVRRKLKSSTVASYRKYPESVFT